MESSDTRDRLDRRRSLDFEECLWKISNGNKIVFVKDEDSERKIVCR